MSGLIFQEDTHELFSASFDRTVKSWSLDDMGYLDTLFGHQAEVLSIDMLRTERAVTTAADRTCRVWKISESSQLVFRWGSQKYQNDLSQLIEGQTGGCGGILCTLIWETM